MNVSVKATYIRGVRQTPSLIINNFKYIKHRSSQRATYWKCQRYDLGQCKARCTITVDQTIKLSGEHSHSPLKIKLNLNQIITEEIYQVDNCQLKLTERKFNFPVK